VVNILLDNQLELVNLKHDRYGGGNADLFDQDINEEGHYGTANDQKLTPYGLKKSDSDPNLGDHSGDEAQRPLINKV
jgi:hypothetical protein